MAKKPRIGITGNYNAWSPGWWITSMVIRCAGGIPERISVRHKSSGSPLDGLIIGGGDDIGPEHYNGDLSEKVKSDPGRDKLECCWINHALDKQIPLLGICRGAQLINVVLGGSLYQDIRFLRKRTKNRPGLLPTKAVALTSGAMVTRIFKRSALRVNSLHHQAIRECGDSLKVVGRDLDGIVQAVESDTANIIGLQWHPEYLFYLPSQFALFRWLVQMSKS